MLPFSLRNPSSITHVAASDPERVRSNRVSTGISGVSTHFIYYRDYEPGWLSTRLSAFIYHWYNDRQHHDRNNFGHRNNWDFHRTGGRRSDDACHLDHGRYD